MKKKQTAKILLVALAFSTMLSFGVTSETKALTRDQFVQVLCEGMNGPEYNSCAREARTGTYQLAQRTIRFSDNKDKSVAQFKNFKGNQQNQADDEAKIEGDCGGVETAIIKCSQDNEGNEIEDNAIWGLLLIVINILTAGVVVVAIAGIVYASFLYTTADNNSGQVTKAKETIFNVMLGIALFAGMYAFLQFLIPGGIFR